MIRPAIIAASLAGVTAASVSIAPPASAATVDREQRMCGAALVSAELERPDSVRITATGPAGTACSLRLSL